MQRLLRARCARTFVEFSRRAVVVCLSVSPLRLLLRVLLPVLLALLAALLAARLLQGD